MREAFRGGKVVWSQNSDVSAVDEDEKWEKSFFISIRKLQKCERRLGQLRLISEAGKKQICRLMPSMT